MTKPILLLGDSCTGTDTPHMANLERVIDVATELVDRHGIETGFFLGDQVMGYCDADTLRAQWREFEAGPINRLRDRLASYRQIASNHVCYDEPSAEVYPEFAGAAEWTATIDGVQYLALNTAYPSRQGNAGIDCDMLERRLAALAQDLPIIVLGHHPIWPINGYNRDPLWMVPPDEGRRAWALLLQYGVELYACSHIIAFDVQLHEGLPQVCTGGAGTEYGPGGAMPGSTEGLHVVLVDGFGTDDLTIRRIPASDTPPEAWFLRRTNGAWAPKSRPIDPHGTQPRGYTLELSRPAHLPEKVQVFAEPEGPPVLSLQASSSELEIALTPAPGDDPLTWRCTLHDNWQKLQVTVNEWTGPGGVLVSVDDEPFTSMLGDASRGLELARPLAERTVSVWNAEHLH